MRRAAVLAIALALFLSGCSGVAVFSDYRELENIDMIQMIGIDKDESGVTVIAGSNMSMTEEAKLYKNRAASLAAALYGMERMPAGKEMLMSHTDCVVIGEEAAKAGMSEYTDYLARDTDMRMDTSIFIVHGGTAEDFIKETSSGGASAYDMLEIIKKDIGHTGDGYVFTGEDLAAKMSSGKGALALSVRAEESGELSREGEPEGKMAVPAGFAVLREGKLSCYLTPDETAGASILLGKMKSGIVKVSAGGGSVTLMLSNVKAEAYPVFDKSGRISSAAVKIKADASIVSADGDVKITDDAVRRGINRTLSEHCKEKVHAAVTRAQAEDLDFLDLGGMLRRKAPVKFGKMERAGTFWDDIFKDVSFSIDAETEVRRTYDIGDPADTTGEGEEKEDAPWKKTTG